MATGSDGNSADGSGNGPGNGPGSDTGDSAVGLTANTQASSDSTSASSVANGDAGSGKDAPTTSTASSNGDTTSPSNGEPSIGPATQTTPVGQSGAGTHATQALPQADAQHAIPAHRGSDLDDKSSLVQAPGSVSSIGNPSLTHVLPAAGSSASSSPGNGATADAFTALDGGLAAGHGVLLHAGPHQVSVGVADPTLGWVEVRAERVGGQITAALTANSAASHAALTSVMPSMTTYLQNHQAGVQHVHVETALAGGQAGAGSQGQSSPQGDARGGAESVAVPASIGAGWRSGATIAEQASRMTMARSTREGHQVSVRA